MTDEMESFPMRYSVSYCRQSVNVSRREFERVQRFIARQQKLSLDAATYLTWLVAFRRAHPHTPRVKETTNDR
jgi:hypothetical protein